MRQNRWRTQAGRLFFFGGIAIALRLLSFFPSVINHDESTYIVISDALAKGQMYWVDIIDTKPIGVFLVFLLLQKIVGSSIFALRLVTTLIVGSTAYMLYRGKRNLGSSEAAARAAGVIFLFMCSIFTFYGVSPNTETFFVACTAAAFWALSGRLTFGRAVLAGLLLGVGFVIKYVVLFDAVALGMLLLAQGARAGVLWGRILGYGLGLALPFSLVALYYGQMGQLDTFLFYTFELSSRYPESAVWSDYIVATLDFFLRFFPVTILLVASLMRFPLFPGKWLGLIWSVLVLIVILLPGTFYGHYFIQLMLPVSLLAGEAFGPHRSRLPGWLRWFFRRVPGTVFIVLLVVLNWFFQKKDFLDRPDYPRRIAEYIAPRLEPDETIYLANTSHIAYHLLERTSPIRYVHPSLFWSEKHITALEVDVAAELARLQQADPAFIILKDDERIARRTAFMIYLEQHFTKVKEIDNIQIYARK